MISIICVYNDRAKLERLLLKSLATQDVPFELITLDNTAGQYPSAPTILNTTARQVKHDWLMFVHQDVSLESPGWLRETERQLESLKQAGAAGVAGMDTSGRLSSAVCTGSDRQFIGDLRVDRPQPVQTLDGCLMLVSKALFLEQLFDEISCAGWYLYVAEFCLQLRRRGLSAYVLSQPVYHESPGPADGRRYRETVNRICAKHRDHVPVIYTTMGIWHARPSLQRILLPLRRLRVRFNSLLALAGRAR